MFITTLHGITERSVRLEDIESFASTERYMQDCEIVMYLRNRTELDDSITISYMLVHDEKGDLFYEKVEDLQHLMKLIEKEEDYLARKELFLIEGDHNDY